MSSQQTKSSRLEPALAQDLNRRHVAEKVGARKERVILRNHCSRRQRRPWGLVAAGACLLSVAVSVALGPGSTAGEPEETIVTAPRDAWPQFRGNPQLTGGAGTQIKPPLRLAWRFQPRVRDKFTKQETTDAFRSSAAVANGRVYVGADSGTLYCLSLRDGNPIWTYRVPESAPISSSPLVLRSSVYFGDENGVLYALDADTGKLRWTVRTDAQILASPNYYRELILVGSYDNKVYAVDASSGKVRWTVETGSYVHSSPAIAEKYTFAAGCDALLHVIELSTGEVVRQIDLEAQAGASPAVVGRYIYVGNMDGAVFAFDWQSGRTVWRYSPPQRAMPFYSSAAVTHDLVIVGGRDRQVHAISRKTGDLRWMFRTRGRVDSSPVVSGRFVVVGSFDGTLYVLRLSDGHAVWQYPLGGRISASPAIADGCVVIGTESGTLYCFRSSP